MFEGLRFVVRLQDAEEKKAMVQRLAEHGGKQETYPMAGAIIIQDKPDFRLTLENGPTSCNVVKVEGGGEELVAGLTLSSGQPSWVLACEKAGKRLDFERSHMLWANEETKRLMDENTDVYGKGEGQKLASSPQHPSPSLRRRLRDRVQDGHL